MVGDHLRKGAPVGDGHLQGNGASPVVPVHYRLFQLQLLHHEQHEVGSSLGLQNLVTPARQLGAVGASIARDINGEDLELHVCEGLELVLERRVVGGAAVEADHLLAPRVLPDFEHEDVSKGLRLQQDGLSRVARFEPGQPRLYAALLLLAPEFERGGGGNGSLVLIGLDHVEDLLAAVGEAESVVGFVAVGQGGRKHHD
mmetsp:Transcript_1114/g.2046  ORF Transcript_1114/g.2046 Transcript_1114/m.2046 type:complete len:200 (+) Transcript_1114:1489-2088(+)